ncbi:hypothetical protein BK011_03090 [Tenericutes bacterium MZ-XQ]|jgi:hypothetical protein|nr:hypothetical protein BK011_03090 [Tenericutes bacterium MZ-XQ]
MKKIYVSMIVILLIVSTIISISYAWFTYVERKSLASFEAGELSIDLKANDLMFDFDITLQDIVFIDYENDLILDKYDTFNHLASSVKIDILSNEDSPLSRHLITIDESILDDGLLYVIIYEGVNLDDTYTLISDYHTYIANVIAGYSDKASQLQAISDHNALMIETMHDTVMKPLDQMTFQIVFWGDYNELQNPETYLEQIFEINLLIESINHQGDLIP